MTKKLRGESLEALHTSGATDPDHWQMVGSPPAGTGGKYFAKVGIKFPNFATLSQEAQTYLMRVAAKRLPSVFGAQIHNSISPATVEDVTEMGRLFSSQSGWEEFINKAMAPRERKAPEREVIPPLERAALFFLAECLALRQGQTYGTLMASEASVWDRAAAAARKEGDPKWTWALGETEKRLSKVVLKDMPV